MQRDPILAPGWQASLDLRFSRRAGDTVLAERRHRGPLRVQKPFYPEGGGVCHAIVLHPPAGIAGGDELEIGAVLEDGAHALLTTPGAGKWYRSAGPRARQSLDFEIGAGAALEWLPQETIVFDGAAARMESRIRLAAEARFIGWEVLCLGRKAAGERFTKGELRLATRIVLEDRLLWLEQGRIAGDSPLLESPMGLAGFSVCGTLLATGHDIEAGLLAACREIVPREEGARTGVTGLPRLLVARYLGHSSEAARAWFVSLWRELRPALIGREAQPPRIWST
ncbi:MAG: urease accessory protein [Rhodocyclaceae bacterium]|jgi:urease accessory protein|nr:urease accessory protein [Rhodocyclaceae bacterium]